MKLNVPYRILDIQPDPNLLNFDFSTITEEMWSKAHRIKISSPGYFDEMNSFGILYIPIETWHDFDLFKNYNSTFINTDHPIHFLIKKEIKKLEAYYNATAKMSMLDRLRPGAIIRRHFDEREFYTRCHRVHLPLVTDPNVQFIIEDKSYYFKVGEYFEFDNKRLHEVRNESNIFRIHLIVDLLPNEDKGSIV